MFGGKAIKYVLRDNDTNLAIGAVTLGDAPQTILFDAALQTKFDKIARVFPGEVVRLQSATSSLDRMIVYTEGPGDSGTYFFVDYPTKKIEAIGWSYPTILQGDVGPVKAFSV